MAKDYFAWISDGREWDAKVGLAAKTQPAGTVRVLYPSANENNEKFGMTAYVNTGPDDPHRLWVECIACYAVEDQCPEHGTAHV